MIRTLTYYAQRRLPGSVDYNKLLWLCRKEGVTYTLLVKASIEVIDLTDDVTRIGEAPVAHGSFADVWKGLWTDRQDKGRKKLVSSTYSFYSISDWFSCTGCIEDTSRAYHWKCTREVVEGKLANHLLLFFLL